MQVYLGVDFHPHQQTVAWCDYETGEIKTRDLVHQKDEVKEFYKSFPPAIVGIEASSNAVWFEALMTETGHHLRVGNPTLIRARARSRHKSDKRDAELILDLLMKGEFPAIWRRPEGSNQVLEVLHLRMCLVRQRTQIYNRLQALAHSCGLPKGRMKSARYLALLKQSAVSETQVLGQEQLSGLLNQFNQQILELESWLKAKAEDNKDVQLLLTQKGVGLLTALSVVHTLGEVQRFGRIHKQVVAFAGLDPLEKSSAGKVRFGGISKKGNQLLRFQLGQAGNIAARSDGKLKSFHKRLAKKKPRSVVKTAVARKLLVKLAIMLRDQITAAEFDERGRAVEHAR